MKFNSLGISILFLFANSINLQAADRVTRPIEGEPFVYFKIDQCDGTKAFGNYWYFTNKGPIVALSDICIDEKLGAVKSYEPRSGYVLAQKSETGKLFEIIESSNIQSLRSNIKFLNMDCNYKEEYYVFNGRLQRSNNIVNVNGTNFEGYTIPSTTTVPAKSTAEFTSLAIYLFSQAQFHQQTAAPETGHGIGNIGFASFIGDLEIAENIGTFVVTKAVGDSVGDASGILGLEISPEGTVAFSGKISAKNKRLAGHMPGEWTMLTVEFPFTRGHLLGTKGNTLKAFGIAKGHYVDTNGQTHQFHAKATFKACITLGKQ